MNWTRALPWLAVTIFIAVAVAGAHWTRALPWLILAMMIAVAVAGARAARWPALMNWTHGLLRVWFAVTLLWLALAVMIAVGEPKPPPTPSAPAAWWEKYSYSARRAAPAAWWEKHPPERYRDRMVTLFWFAVIPPSALFVLGCLGIWVRERLQALGARR